MATEITYDGRQLNRALKRLNRWANVTYFKTLGKATTRLTEDYKKRIRSGQTGDGSRMPLVKESTMGMPIRFATDRAIRGEVRGSRTPLVARGNAVNSLKKYKRGTRYEIEPSTPHGKLIFNTNAKSKKGRVKRDPLIVSDKQLDIIETEILKDLDKILRG